MTLKKIGVLTGGGDCPGLNAVIRAIVRSADRDGVEVIGFLNGWRGLIQNEYKPLGLDNVSGILHRGGTILGTSRTNPYKKEEDVKKVKENFAANKLDALVAIGGEDTLGVAEKLSAEGLSVVGVPKTIDNDLPETDYTFGFDTAINIVTDAIDRLHTTAESHDRVMVVEIMGRHAGWIAAYSGLAGGADMILVPEIPIQIDEVVRVVEERTARGKTFSIIAVAEGAQFAEGDMATVDKELDAFGHVRLGGIGQRLAELIEERTGHETRVTVLGHTQRGGSPTAMDRILGTRFGVKAYQVLKAGETGKMVSLKGTKIEAVPIANIRGKLKTLDMEFYEIAKIFFG
ncbi:MAG: 6-phosphofructokinase [Candidatus Omnitrophica bacterium]|nr:6-phosphofructokinase [Candidatus Omnitrophota bacterium]